MISPIIKGTGAVSPAGWDGQSLCAAIANRSPLPASNLSRPGSAACVPYRAVPLLSHRPAFLAHSRLRRTSPIAQFTVAAALEALGSDVEEVRNGSRRLGIVLCVMAGCVNYSRRFYAETLADPSSASPLVFPETVFNSPASHLAAIIGSAELNYTLVGDPGMFLVGISVAARWLADGKVDCCLVVGAEESDWLVADAFRRFEREAILAEGAGAVYLEGRSSARRAIRLQAITDAHVFTVKRPRTEAALAMRAELPSSPGKILLSDSTLGLTRADRAEERAWDGWTGPRLSVKRILGEGLASGSAWQCVAAIQALHKNECDAAIVSVVGCNQQAIGAVFESIR